MTTLTALAALRAASTGHAEPIATVCHVHLEERPFVLVPLTLAGEACAPLAALAGTDLEQPILLTVHQPRNRAARFRFAEELAELVLPYLAERLVDSETYLAGREKEERSRAVRGPQLIIPNGEGIGWLSRLGRLTRLRATEGPFAVHPSVVLLGKWLTWFTDRSEFPGTSTLLAMTRLLAEHWATGQSSAEDSHLASLLAWIDPPARQSGAAAARAAEDPAACPPAGPATDSLFDSTTLHGLMTGYDEALSDLSRAGFARAMDRELRAQMLPTWNSTWQGLGLLRALPKAGQAATRWQHDRQEFSSYSTYLAEDGRPQSRRDPAVGAARRLARLEEAGQLYQVQRAFDDPLVMAEYELTGEAFTGTVVDRDPDRLDCGGKTPRRRPTITLRTTERPEVTEGATVRSPARPGQPTLLKALTPVGPDGFEVLLEIIGGLGRGYKQPLTPGVVPDLGEELTYTTLDPSSPPFRLPAAEDTPWTHGGPPQPYEPTADDAEETWA
ncbi:hypothetical protein [Kitasatospora kifunensis]|uniref:Uncharacterized protein n=1 Tax=Kitasatospora kifunensis TaxID=58351 RepID=A0A7W7QY25_KITKI|nr:hypothetical protein [Kitasatospora kifunensis]MBB4921903.1 hypothetical protein [Kitasatospora kifunensis]